MDKISEIIQPPKLQTYPIMNTDEIWKELHKEALQRLSDNFRNLNMQETAFEISFEWWFKLDNKATDYSI